MAESATQHIDRISALISGRPLPNTDTAVSKSWLRCANTLRIDPASKESPRILTRGELSPHRDEAAKLLEIAQPELDRLYAVVQPARYVVLLTNPDGVVIDHRGDEDEAGEFKRWGIWLGGVWAENVEGTNGIGTCLAEGRPINVHQSDHFRARHITLSCSGAPLFDGAAKLVGVLDVSCFDPELSEHAHALTGSLTLAAARAIEERLFREQFRREWIIVLGAQDEIGVPILLAVDKDRRISGANRAARGLLAQAGHRFEPGLGLWTMFVRDERLLRRRDQGDISGQLTSVKSGEARAAILTPPLPSLPGWLDEALYWRPRLNLLLNERLRSAPSDVHGGLTPATLRRVHDYVESHLDQQLDLESLAAAAGLSVYHFARVFKQSEGMTPHGYVLTRRLAKARELLQKTDLSLSEVALASGFADQSHFTRRFHRLMGVSPGQFRRSQH